MVVARPAPSDREESAGLFVALCFTPRRPSIRSAYGVRATLVLKLIATSVPEKEKHDGRKLLVQFCRRQIPWVENTRMEHHVSTRARRPPEPRRL